LAFISFLLLDGQRLFQNHWHISSSATNIIQLGTQSLPQIIRLSRWSRSIRGIDCG